MTFSEIQPKIGLDAVGIHDVAKVHWNLAPSSLIEETIRKGQGQLADTGALCVNTGEFTGRSPKDKFLVEESTTRDQIWWGSINQPISPEHFDKILADMQDFLVGKELYARDLYAGADPTYRINVRVINTLPWANLFTDNMFICPEIEALAAFDPDWTVIAAPEFHADPAVHGTRQHNFSIIHLSRKLVLVGGSGYTGEIKKGIFTVLNYLLPQQGVLPMHCSANIGDDQDTAVFFGLSGTGKTTLSADPNRGLIGDDEHGWSPDGVFNFEGGCYAKCIDLTAEKEPEIWAAIKYGALVENTHFHPGSRTIDFANTEITENTRVSYPINHIENAVSPSIGTIPKNIFFLTCDAFGVLPPISRLSAGQAMYQFILGYTAKVAGTEEGITEPVATFSSCFGAPFLPLHPTRYAEMLGEKMKQYGTQVWLVNTGWTGGPYGVGNRMKLGYTRAMITAALEGKLQDVAYHADPIFGLEVPAEVVGVPSEVLNPRDTWADKAAFDKKALELAQRFTAEFAPYSDFASDEMRAAAPPGYCLGSEHVDLFHWEKPEPGRYPFCGVLPGFFHICLSLLDHFQSDPSCS